MYYDVYILSISWENMSRILVCVFWLVVCNLVLAKPLLAAEQVSLNEFVSDTAGTTSDPDWVEVYNTDTNDIDLTGYFLKDATGNEKQLSGILSAHGFSVFEWTNKLNKDTDTIQLIKDGNVVDEISYGSPQVPAPLLGQSVGRSSDGSGAWIVFSSFSKGSSNSVNQAAPTSTPIPTQIPTPTKVPTPTKTPTPTRTPTPTKIPTPTRTPTPIKEAVKTPTPTIVKLPTTEVKAVSTSSAQASDSAQKNITGLDDAVEENNTAPTSNDESTTLVASQSARSWGWVVAAGCAFVLAGGILGYLKIKR